MNLWFYFWTAAFLIAVSSFAFIASVVAVRGLADLKSLIRILAAEKTGDRRDVSH